jgi:aryl-alcohol dehydrogenase-like predicted oxidoreductase
MTKSFEGVTRMPAGLFSGLEMGVGTWQWGDTFIWQYGRGYSAEEVRAAFKAALAAGLTFFDTAEVYGFGRPERFLGEFMHTPEGAQAQVRVATKFAALPWRPTASSVVRALRGSLKRLGLPAVDLYQIHWPLPLLSIETLMSGLADAVDAGLARAVGVSNYSLEHTQRAHAALARRGVALASNQVHYSLLNRQVERAGLLAQCTALGVKVIAYSPLEMGLLSGKYTPERPLPGSRARRYSPAYLARIQPLIGRLRQMGEAHAGPDGARNPAQVALNWTVCKGTLPIPGAKNAQQVQQNAGAVGWRLTADEVAELDELSQAVQVA